MQEEACNNMETFRLLPAFLFSQKSEIFDSFPPGEAIAASPLKYKEAADMQKKIPQRQCMGCRERKDKRAMIRVVRCTDGEVRLDFSGKLNGRGAYVCPDKTCLQKARKTKALERALETPIPEEVYDRLEKEMEAGGNA